MKDSRKIAEEVLDRAKRLGADFTEVLVSHADYSFKRVTDGEVYQPTSGDGITIHVSAIISGRRVTTAFDSVDAIEMEVNNLFAKAKFIERPAEEPYIPSGPFPKASVDEKLLYDPEIAKMDDSRLIHIIKQVNDLIEPNGFVFDGAVSQGVGELLFANSVGTFQSYKATESELSIFGFDKKDRSISAYRTVSGKSIDFKYADELARDVHNKLKIQKDYLAKHGGKRIDPFAGKGGPQRFDVIMEPSCWAGMLAIFSGQAGAWNGKSYHDGVSFFSGKLGQKVMGDNITIYDDPLNPLGIPQPFDYEGYPTKKLVLVEKGVAKNVAYDNALAKKYNTASTGHALPGGYRDIGALPLHLAVEGGNSSVPDMIKSVKEPTLWITTLHYIRATHVQDGRATGTTLHGVFLVKDGEVVGPTEHLRFDESLPEALSRVTHIGKAIPTLSMETDTTPYIVPPMLSKQFRFVSVADRSV